MGECQTANAMTVMRKNKLNSIGFIWDPQNDKWESGFTAFVLYQQRYGHTLVPKEFIIDDYPLGQWVGVQRQSKASLSDDRVSRLSESGFIWNAIDFNWEMGFKSLLDFFKTNGHTNVPQSFVLNEFPLGSWVHAQRSKKQKLTVDRIKKLDQLSLIWDPLDIKWETGYSNLLKFIELEGHCNVPSSYLLKDYKLGGWVIRQRTRKERLTDAQVKKLDELGFVWDPFSDFWEEGFNALVIFKEREGHCIVPVKHIENGYKLGQWVGAQRTSQSKISEDRLSRLDEIGYVWSPQDHRWEEGFSALVTFKAREGHCRVSQKYLENGYKLGQWVAVQRREKQKLSIERIKRLNDLGFIWKVKN